MKRLSSTLLAIVLVAGFAGGILCMTSLGAGKAGHDEPQASATQTRATPHSKELLNQFSAAFEDAAAKVNPSVVPIFSESVTHVRNPFGDGSDNDFFRHFFGQQPRNQRQAVRSLGSGVIVSPDGYILTNNHVVDGADKLTVTLKDKKKLSAKVVGRDPQTDIAVIKIDATGLPAATLGNSDTIRVGQWVIAVGNPFQLMHTVTAGIISAKGRSSVNLTDYEDYIQTDASINPGNSGGALADLDGNVIGINSAIYSPNGSGNVGIGFAVPINLAKSVMRSLIDKGSVSRGYLGLLPQDIDENLAKALDLKNAEGALVGSVTSGGPADKAGIKSGDVIVALNGTKVTGSVQLRTLVAEAVPGSVATLSISRKGSSQEITVKLAERPKDLSSRSGSKEETDEGQSGEKLGLTIQTLNRELAEEYGYSGEKGVVVTAVQPGSPADDAGAQRGDLIKEVDRTPVSSVSEFNMVAKKGGKTDSIALLVRRGENTFFLALQP